jgi:transmembrane sensor
MEKQHFLILLDKYINRQTTQEEQGLLEEYYKRLDALSELELSDQEESKFQQSMLQQIQTRIATEEEPIQPKLKRSYKIWYMAASILLLLAVGSYFYEAKTPAPVVQNANLKTNDISPGSNKAVLTLSNGKKIVLSDANNGVLTNQGSTKIVKKANGELAYQVENKDSNPQTLFNTITIPRGGQYEVILPDGTTVLLNAASSLTYPTQFNGKQRTVELKGEAYFEVAKRKAMPFVVKTSDIEIKVLGTHFNISAYQDDPAITTTLLEGSVSINKGNVTTLLKPGQQGIARSDLSTVAVQDADVEQVMGWTKGSFVFADLSIKEVMKIASRWYDIDVEYQGNVQSKKFGGTTSRYKNITELLEYMKITGGVNYKIEGRRVILMN